MERDMQRRLFRHGFAILTGGFVLGLVVGGMGGGPRARLWLGSHVTALLVGLMVVAVGVVWPHLSLGERGRKVLATTTIAGNWFSFAMLGVFVPVVGFPSKLSTPTLPDPPAWAAGVVGLSLVVVTLSTFVMCGCVLYGLRRAESPAREHSADERGVRERSATA
jgi:hypothetical protein